jgi:uncharacterized membrane protein YobD (UPF0266 family)
MRFEEMKKIWDDQNKEHVFAIDEKQLHQNIEEKKRKSSALVSKIEIMLIVVNSLASSTIIGLNVVQRKGNIFENAMALLMLATAIYIIFRRAHRLKNENRFDRTMLGDLDHAISNATYQAQLSYGMLINCVIMGILLFFNAVAEDKSPTTLFLIAVLFAITIYLSRWEHRSWHVARKKRLEGMRAKLNELE